MKNLLQYISLLLCLFLQTMAMGQYSLTGRDYVDSGEIVPSNLGKIYLEGFGNTLRIYSTATNSSSANLTITDLNTKTLIPTNTFQISDVKIVFPYADILATTNHDILIGYNYMYVYNRLTKETHSREYSTDTIKYKRGYMINDSLIYLSSIYNYHPFSCFPGAHLSVFNLNTNKIIKSAILPFKGILLSSMINNWDYCVGDSIYIIHPLTGLLYTYNTDFELIDSLIIDLPWKNKERNITYQTVIDSLVYNDYHKMATAIAKYGKDSVGKNRNLDAWSNQSRESLDRLIKTTRKDYEYIEKIIPYNDSVFIISICRPEYDLKYRDVYFYNRFSKKVVGKKEKWQCGRQDTLTKPEDFFVVDIINSNPVMPYFHDGRVYALSMYNPKLFKSGPKNDFSEILYNDVLKNNYRCHILEYKL